MNVTRAIDYMLFIVTFICLVMCPTVHEFADDVRHDMLHKVGVKKTQNNFKKGGNTTPAQSLYNTKSFYCIQSRTPQKILILSSSYSTLDPSILSSVRLILWVLHSNLAIPWYKNRSLLKVASWTVLQNNQEQMRKGNAIHAKKKCWAARNVAY